MLHKIPLPLHMSYFTYIIQSLKTGKYYTGSSENPEKRLQQHNWSRMFDFKPSWTNLAFLFIDTFTFFDVVS
jgi:predicted GIY-YIG superfamily endonuclease